MLATFPLSVVSVPAERPFNVNFVENPSFEQNPGSPYQDNANDLCAIALFGFCAVNPSTISPWVVAVADRSSGLRRYCSNSLSL